MRRRTFLEKTLAGTAFFGLGGLPLLGKSPSTPSELTILHTNDLHGYWGTRALGLKETVAAIRREKRNVLLFDSGDFMPPPGGQSTGFEVAEWMKAMSYDAVTFGHQEFNCYPEILFQQFNYVNIPVIHSFSNGLAPYCEKAVAEYCIVDRGSIRVGVVGIGGNKGTGIVQDIDIVHIVDNLAYRLKQEYACSLVICLSRLGFCYGDNRRSDLTLAAQSRFIDVILGGTTHTFLEEAEVCTNKLGEQVWVSHAGMGGRLLGCLDLNVPATGKTKLIHSEYLPVASASAENV